MAGEQNVENAKRAYAAFSQGDAETAMANMADDVEWITPGNSTISGTLRGKQAVGELWASLAEKGFKTSPQYWYSDDERVVVLTQITVAGEQADSVDVLTYRDGKLTKFQTAGDMGLLEHVFGSKPPWTSVSL
jgi:ketosteroid isomerase-like protein